MREWLSGGAPPCQGGGRGFDPRLALEKRTIPNRYRSFFRALPGLESSMSTLRSGPHGKFQKQKGIRICSGLYRSFILYAHDRGTRLYWAGLFNGKELFKNILARSEQVKKIILPLHRSNEKDS